MSDETYASIREASRISGLSVPLLRRRIAAGDLATFHTRADRRCLLVRLADVEGLRRIEPVDRNDVAA